MAQQVVKILYHELKVEIPPPPLDIFVDHIFLTSLCTYKLLWGGLQIFNAWQGHQGSSKYGTLDP